MFGGWRLSVGYYTYPARQDRSLTVSVHTHSYTKQVQDKAPTCTAAGSGHYECPTDGAKGSTYSIPALGHSYGSWSSWAKYGNTTNHRRSRKCSRCGNIEYSYENHKDANNDGACDTCGEIYRNRHTLSIKRFLNGANQESINPYGLFTLKIDGRNIISNQTSWSGIIADGTAYTITPTANTGYQYMGIKGGSLSESMSASDKIIRLSFDNFYTIVFDGNNATGSSTSSITNIPYTTAKNLTANGFYRDGYSFTGWTGNTNGTGSSYSNQQTVSKLSATPNGVVNLYATLYGSSATVARSYNIESTSFTLPKPSLNNYTFKGWIGGIDKKDPVRDANGKTYSSSTASITVPKGTYGDYFFRAVFEKNHSSVDGDRTDDIYVAHSETQEKQY